MYAAMLRRQAKEGLERRRDLIIAGLYANPNLDGEEANRSEVVEHVERIFNESIDRLYGYETTEEREEAALDTPFFQGMKLPPLNPESDIPLTAGSSADADTLPASLGAFYEPD